jgi:hypothetical protein
VNWRLQAMNKDTFQAYYYFIKTRFNNALKVWKMHQVLPLDASSKVLAHPLRISYARWISHSTWYWNHSTITSPLNLVLLHYPPFHYILAKQKLSHSKLIHNSQSWFLFQNRPSLGGPTTTPFFPMKSSNVWASNIPFVCFYNLRFVCLCQSFNFQASFDLFSFVVTTSFAKFSLFVTYLLRLLGTP